MAKAEVETNLRRETGRALASIEHIVLFGKLAASEQVIQHLSEIREAVDLNLSLLLTTQAPDEPKPES